MTDDRRKTPNPAITSVRVAVAPIKSYILTEPERMYERANEQ